MTNTLEATIAGTIALLVIACWLVWRHFFRNPLLMASHTLNIYPARPPSSEDLQVAALERKEQAEREAREIFLRTKCIHCNDRATRPSPQISGIPLEDWVFVGWLISFLWKVFSLPPVFRVHSSSGEPTFCESHELEAWGTLENDCAQIRATYAKFNLETNMQILRKNRSFRRSIEELK